MWHNPSTMEAVEDLKKMGKTIINPEIGELASLHEGEGRLASPLVILNTIRETLKIKQPLKNRNILITAGPTIEPIDPVRFISNHSSGKMGYALADVACNQGANVTLISGPVNLKKHPESKLIKINTAEEMLKEIKNCNLSKIDYIFMCAAISDYKPANVPKQKMKRSEKNVNIKCQPNPDILKNISANFNGKIIAFALETEKGKGNAKEKMNNKNADFIVLNYANEEGAGFNSNTNHVYVYNKNGQEIEFKKDRKDRIAKQIIDWVMAN